MTATGDMECYELPATELDELFWLAPTAMLLSDLATARPLVANACALELFGVNANELDGLPDTGFWDDPAERDHLLTQVREHGLVRSQRVRLRKADGRVFWAGVSAREVAYSERAAILITVTDVSEVVATEDILHRTQQTLMTLLEASPFPLIVTRLDNDVIRYCNQQAADMFETPLSGLLGHAAPEFYVDPLDRDRFVERLRVVGKVDGFIARLKTRSGQPFWAMLSAKTLDLNGEAVFMVAFADVSRQKAKEEELETLAFKDSLTNAYNRRYFLEAARNELARAERRRESPCLAVIDVDHFKQLNDTFGHEAGDSVLRELVGLLKGMLRKSDILARYGGEEFVILLPSTTLAEAHNIIERMRQRIAGHAFDDTNMLRITFSAGIASFSGMDSWQGLIARADKALYLAKRRGRDRIELETSAP